MWSIGRQPSDRKAMENIWSLIWFSLVGDKSEFSVAIQRSHMRQNPKFISEKKIPTELVRPTDYFVNAFNLMKVKLKMFDSNFL